MELQAMTKAQLIDKVEELSTNLDKVLLMELN